MATARPRCSEWWILFAASVLFIVRGTHGSARLRERFLNGPRP
jgi:hypothetical protein